MIKTAPKSINNNNTRNSVLLKLLGLVIGCLFFFFLWLAMSDVPKVLVDWGQQLGFDESTGPVGDTIGGTLSPIVALIAAILTFFAFWIQYEANLQQKVDLARERFENKFFEMLRQHKENVSEMNIEGYEEITTETHTNDFAGGFNLQESKQVVSKMLIGKRYFVEMYWELFVCYKICEDTLLAKKFEGKERYLIKLSYKLAYNGANASVVTSIDEKVEADQQMVSECKAALIAARNTYVDKKGRKNSIHLKNANILIQIPIIFKPFSGHSARLGHYYRQLFMTVKYVANQPEELVIYNEKREYLRMLRAQLTGYEQLMLYYNYISGYGAPWENGQNEFLSKFRMIHNMPLELANLGIKPSVEFAVQIQLIKNSGEAMFEYDE